MYWERFGYMLCYINSTIKCEESFLKFLMSCLCFRLVLCFMLCAMVHFDERLLVYFVANVIVGICPQISKKLIVFKRKRNPLALNKCDFVLLFVHQISVDRSKTIPINSFSYLH